MSVSISQTSNLDLDAIVAGGDAFMERVKSLHRSKAAYDAAFENLNIGKSAAEAYADAQRMTAAAVKLTEETKIETDRLLAETSKEAGRIVAAAQAEATALLGAAKNQSDSIEQEVRVAREKLNAWSNKTQADAQAILDRAISIQAAADNQAVANAQAATVLAAAQAKAEAAHSAAEEKHRILHSKLEAIKAAAL